MKATRFFLNTLILASAAASLQAIAADQPAGPVVVDEDGTVHVPAFVLPPSDLASPEARQHLKQDVEMAQKFGALLSKSPDIPKARKDLADLLAPRLASTLNKYPVKVSEELMGGVPVRVVTPEKKPTKPERVLIHLHGGGFIFGWETGSLTESAPIAAEGGYRIVSVNYRKAPEAKHPAAVEDIEKVYRELLKQYDPRKIGVFGCSAGGALTAQTAAWLPAHNLPQVGAIGIFGAGGVRFTSGDSNHVSPYLAGLSVPKVEPTKANARPPFGGYFSGANMDDAIISPALHPEVLKKFPPTMIITGTRAVDMSPAVYTNSQLINVGKNPLMIVAEGMGHCYYTTWELPESRDTYRAIVRFFDENLD